MQSASAEVDFATLLKRTFAAFVVTCDRRRGPMRIVAQRTWMSENERVTRKIMQRAMPSRAPPPRAQPSREDVWIDPLPVD